MVALKLFKRDKGAVFLVLSYSLVNTVEVTYFERLSLFWVYLLLRLVEWKISPFWKKCHLDVSFKWDCLTERKENVLFLGPVWSDLIMMIICSPFLCSPLHAPIWWDVAMGFSSQQLAGLVPGEQPWSGCPWLSASEKSMGYLWGSSVSPSLCPAPGCGCQGSGLGPAMSFYCVTTAAASLPSCCFLCFCWLLSWVSWLLLSSLDLHSTMISQHWIYLMNLLRSYCWNPWLLKACRLCFLSLSPFLFLPEAPSGLPGFPLLPTPVFLVLRRPWAVSFWKVIPFLGWRFLAEISHSSSPGSSLGLPG